MDEKEINFDFDRVIPMKKLDGPSLGKESKGRPHFRFFIWPKIITGTKCLRGSSLLGTDLKDLKDQSPLIII